MIVGPRYRYPHMLPGDRAVWDRYIEQHGEYFEGFDYDVHVGEGVGEISGYPDAIKKAALVLTQKRIDAVGYRGNEVWVIEIKPHAGLSAIGQVLAYEALYNIEHEDRPVTYKAIVTDRTNADMRTLCGTMGIRLYEVG